MRNTNNLQKADQFDQIIVSRLMSDDFGQPQVKDANWYKSRATIQIENAIQGIFKATNQYEFTTATAQAFAFIDAALNLEIIDLAEKAKWLDDVAFAVRTQMIEESA